MRALSRFAYSIGRTGGGTKVHLGSVVFNAECSRKGLGTKLIELTPAVRENPGPEMYDAGIRPEHLCTRCFPFAYAEDYRRWIEDNQPELDRA